MEDIVSQLDKFCVSDLKAAESATAIRPNNGKFGAPLEVFCNAFQLFPAASLDRFTVYQYSIVLLHPRGVPMPRDTNLHCFQQMIKNRIVPVSAGYDGAHLMYLPIPLDEDEISGTVMVPSSTLPLHDEEWLFHMRLTVEMPLTELRSMFRRLVEDLPAAYSVLQSLGTIWRHAVATKHSVINNKYFPTDCGKPHNIKGVQIQKGYHAAIRVSNRLSENLPAVLLNVDTACAVFYRAPQHPDMTSAMAICLERMSIPATRDNLRYLVRLPEDRIRSLNRFLRNLIVDIRIGKGTSKTRRIRAISSQGAHEITFLNGEGQRITVQEHFFSTYHIELRYPELPCLLFGNKRAAFPIEFCSIRPNQKYRLKLDVEMQQIALKIQSSPPDQRFQFISQARAEAREECEKFRQFGLEVSQTPMKIRARVLNPPMIRYQRDVRADNIKGSWNAKGAQLISSPELNSWAVLDLSACRQNQVEDFVRNLTQKLRSLGIRTEENPPIISKAYKETSSLRDVVKEWITELGKTASLHFGKGPRLLFVITKDNSDNALYHAIKVVGDSLVSRSRVFTTQVLTKAHVLKPSDDQYMTNLGLKINLKLGGINQVVKDVTHQEPTMIVGADVAHGMGNGKPSIAGMVASMDAESMRYAATAAVQPLLESSTSDRAATQEPIVECQSMMAHLLSQWQRCHPKWPVPHHVVYYRDGVSDSELGTILRTEVPAIEDALKNRLQNIYPNGGPVSKVKLTYIVCNKGHHFRFMPTDHRSSHKGNCPAGTIIDSDIVSPLYYDFYAVTHGAILGTSRPVRYIILKDDGNMGPDRIQQLTSHLCYGFQRATRAVGLVTPAYYADIVAGRARLWILNNEDDGTSSELGGTSTQAERDQQLQECRAVLNDMLGGLEAIGDSMWWL